MLKNDKNPNCWIRMEEVQKHITDDSAWIVIHDKVYDITNYIDQHPRGSVLLPPEAGNDATECWDKFRLYHYHAYSKAEQAKLYIGDLHPDDCLEDEFDKDDQVRDFPQVNTHFSIQHDLDRPKEIAADELSLDDEILLILEGVNRKIQEEDEILDEVKSAPSGAYTADSFETDLESDEEVHTSKLPDLIQNNDEEGDSFFVIAVLMVCVAALCELLYRAFMILGSQ